MKFTLLRAEDFPGYPAIQRVLRAENPETGKSNGRTADEMSPAPQVYREDATKTGAPKADFSAPKQPQKPATRRPEALF